MKFFKNIYYEQFFCEKSNLTKGRIIFNVRKIFLKTFKLISKTLPKKPSQFFRSFEENLVKP